MKEKKIKAMSWIIKKMSVVFLTSIVNASDHLKSVFLSYQKFEIQPALINLNSNEYSQELLYYPFTVDMLEVVTLSMTYLRKYVFQIRQKI